MATHERINEPTPSGGAYSEIYYLDKEHNPVEPENAYEFIVREYREDGVLLATTRGLM